jgi:hypothetical protein
MERDFLGAAATFLDFPARLEEEEEEEDPDELEASSAEGLS